MHTGAAVPLSEREFLETLIRRTGHEQLQRSIPDGIDAVLKYGDLSLSDLQKNALKLLVDELQFANRFRGEPTFAQGVGEESGTHSVHVARLVVAVADAVLERAGYDVNQFKHDGVIASLDHDLGEVLVGEFSTVRERTQRIGNHTEESSADLERLIFVRSAALALHCAETGSNFKEAMQCIREPLLEDINKITIARLTAAFDSHPFQLSNDAQSILNRRIELYDATEGTANKKSNSRRQIRWHLRKDTRASSGTTPLHQIFKKDPTVEDFSVEGIIYTPWEQSQTEAPLHSERLRSNLVMAGIVRVEGKLGELFELAQTDAQKAIAREIRDRVYLGVIESLDTSTPVVKRSLKDHNEAITQRLMEAQSQGENAVPILEEEYKELLRAYRELRNTNRYQEAQSPANSQLLPIETRLRLQSVYRSALETSYEPCSGEILALRDTIPEKFLPVDPRAVGLSRRGGRDVAKQR